MELTSDEQAQLIAGLQGAGIWPQGEKPDQIIETHISTVLLVGEYAYKIKKPLNLGFLDFSTLRKRKLCCEEEIRLNRRLAPDIYLNAVPISGPLSSPRPLCADQVIEYAVCMRRFDSAGLLSEHIELIDGPLLERLVKRLHDFHRSIAVCDPSGPFGTPKQVVKPMRENFSQLRPLTDQPPQQALLDRLERWTEERFDELKSSLRQRLDEGFIRECHGDLHLGNIALHQQDLIIFDGIEFNPELRWIDVISELAFLLMDLDARRLMPDSRTLLNRYLELSGDYEALPLLRFYQVYRAMVRAKVTAIRLNQSEGVGSQLELLERELEEYLQLAEVYTHAGQGAIIVTHGLSGSGKSTHSLECVVQFPAVRIRSDLERKRLAGLDADSDSASPTGGGLYRSKLTEKTYARLQSLCRSVVQTGMVAIVDATFLYRHQREAFQTLARSLGVPFLILSFEVPEVVLRERIIKRRDEGDDPSEATLDVLEHQLLSAEPLTEQELEVALKIENDHLPLDQIKARIERRT